MLLLLVDTHSRRIHPPISSPSHSLPRGRPLIPFHSRFLVVLCLTVTCSGASPLLSLSSSLAARIDVRICSPSSSLAYYWEIIGPVLSSFLFLFQNVKT
jgi:hypothetical protein